VTRPVGTGSVVLGLTYSRSSNDNIGGSFYNTGDRYMTQFGFTNSLGPGDITLSAWNLFRTPGTLADSSALGHEDITSFQVAYGINALGGRLEPTIEVRSWLQQDLNASLLANPGVRYHATSGPMGVSISGGYSIGRLAAQSASGASVTADLSGFRGTLAVRVGY